jgi:hypothetical protein
MVVRPLRGRDEVVECIRLYIQYNDEELFHADPEIALASFLMMLNRGAFIRVLEEGAKIRGWILAQISRKEFIKEPVLQQCFYCSDFTGVKSVKAVRMLHAALVEEAHYRRIRYVFSTGSYMDTDNVFARILEKEGWKRRGYLAVLDLGG